MTHSTGKRTVRSAYSKDGQDPSIAPAEVRLIALKPDRWEWQVCDGDTPIMTGYATSRETAQIDGDSALFLLLSAG
jgi:hypothetical protein